VSLHRDLELQPLADPHDPDDWRPSSVWALVSDERADVAVVVWDTRTGAVEPA
jgi:hypothetical protein